MGQLSRERLDKMRDISYKYFDWLTILQEAGVKEIQDLDDQLLLKCPRHADKRPSFRVRLHEHDCHCFSCGFWGRALDLMYELSGKQLSKAQYCEQVLKRTPAMQRELGFSSLYVDAASLDPGFAGRRKFSSKDHIGSGMPLSVLSKRVRKSGDTWENLVFSLTLLQEGESPERIYDLVRKNAHVENRGSRVSEVSLGDLLFGEEGSQLND